MSENKVFKEFYVELEDVCRELEFHEMWQLLSRVERLKKVMNEEVLFKRLRESMNV